MAWGLRRVNVCLQRRVCKMWLVTAARDKLGGPVRIVVLYSG